MATIGREAARAPLTSADINDGIVGAQDLQATLDLSSKAVTLPALSSLSVTGDLTVDTNTLYVDSANNRVGVGTTNPAYLIDAQTAAGNAQLSVTSGGDLAQLILKSTDTTGNSQINFADADSSNVGMLQYFHNDNHMEFTVNGAEAMRLDASGNLLVGKTTTALGTAGSYLASGGNAYFTATNNQLLVLNRLSTDGSLAEFYKNGAAVGSIGTIAGSYLTIGTGDTGYAFDDDNDTIVPWNMSSNANRDAAIDLGSGTQRFKDLYLSGGAYLGGTAAVNKLDYYEEGTWTPTAKYGATAVSISINRARYVRIGNWVQVSATISITGVPSTGPLSIQGLPFPAGVDIETTGSIMLNQVDLDTATVNVVTYQYNTGQAIEIYATKDNGPWYRLTNSFVSTGDAMIFTHTYFTT